MRLLSHLVKGEERLAVAIDDRYVLDAVDLLGDGPWTMARLLEDVPANLEHLRDGLRGTSDRARRPAIYSLASLQLLPPVRPSKIVAVGRTTGSMLPRSRRLPTVPLLFAKFPSAIVGDGATITWSAGLTAQVDYEAELAVVIGRRGHNVAVEQALDHVLGYSCLNDVSARDLQVRDGQWTRAKSLIRSPADPGRCG
jgi:2-keto-4-pentenoate hydratase/2-oxohepta-3-ene-1,7-dioic acid hydratase in catechol pathway